MYNKVLVPLDRSELAECTLAHVKNLAQNDSVGEVILLNAVPMEIPFDDIPRDDIDVGRGFDFRAFWKEKLDEAGKYLANAQTKLTEGGIKAGTVVIEGTKPAPAITDFAAKNGVDLIVLATHGYTGMKGMFLGSVAFQVLHESPVPVLLIRPEVCRL